MGAAGMMERMGESSPPLRSAMSVGRNVGVLLLLHFVVGLTVPFILLDRVRGTAGLAANAAGSPGLLRTAVLLLFAGSAMAIAIAVTAWPVVRRHSEAMALWLLALGVAAFTGRGAAA